jgi:hypothetical protein
VIKGRKPGAPSVTPDTGPVSRHGAHGPAGGQAADLGAIRRSDAIIDVLASRRRLRSRALRDPAVAVLSHLAADVDAAPYQPRQGPAGARSPGAHLVGPRPAGPRSIGPRSAGPPPAGRRPAGARPQGSAIAAAAAAIATAAAVLAAAGLVVIAMLTWLTGVRGWDRSRGRHCRPGRYP